MEPPAPSRSRFGGESGQSLPIIIAFLITLLLFCALVIDVGNAWRAKEALQASTDAAATAAAGTLTLSYPPNVTSANNAAVQYGDGTGQLNPIPGIVSGSQTENVNFSCKVQAHYTCTYDNTVDITQTVKVPTYFMGIIGIPSIKLSSHAEACSPCGEIPLDIMLVLDRTGSMADDGGSSNGESKEENLQTGLTQGFLPGLDPTQDQVGLSVLPPDTSTSSSFCNASTNGQQSATYKVTIGGVTKSYSTAKGYTVSNPAYDIISPMEYTYLNSTTGQLVTSDPLVSDINCMKPGGSTSYAGALSAAWTELSNDGRTGVQKVIVMLSDGAANTGQNCSANYKAEICTQPCQAGVDEADSLKASPNDALIYTIIYGSASDYGPCTSYTGSNESPYISPQTAMQEMASPGDYFSDPDPATLTTIFQEISSDMAAGTSRLVQ